MVKLIIINLLVFLSVNYKASAQSLSKFDTFQYMAVYEYNFQPDSTNYRYQNLSTVLIFNKNQSYFLSFTDFVDDTLMYRHGKVLAREMPQYSGASIIPFRIVKMPEKGYYYSRPGIDQFYFAPYMYNFDWSMAEGDTLISGFNCNKATINYSGRHYTAWYTTEIPTSEGPYKFKGLPGLIVKISDNKQQHIFTMRAFLKEKIKFQPNINEGSVEADLAKILKMRQNYKGVLAAEGITFQPADAASEESLRTWMNSYKNENNPIELLEESE